MKPEIFPHTKALDEALTLWMERLDSAGILSPLSSEQIDVAGSLGRVTASPVFARLSSPLYHSSAMDGYAVRHADTIGARDASPKTLRIGTQAVYVNTGEPIPEGFNSVVMVEDVNVARGEIEIISAVTPWQNVRPVGEDIVATELICAESQVIRQFEQCAMLASGLATVDVRRRPKVLFMPTGSELIAPGTEPRRGSIIEFNSYLISGFSGQWGFDFKSTGILPDSPDAIRDAVLVDEGSSDMIVINAGSSTGTKDYTLSVIEKLGEVIVHGLAIKPGKPLILGIAEGRPMMGLPGYPVSAYLAFKLFARPLIMRWLGLEAAVPDAIRATLSRHLSSQMGVDEFVRMKVGRVSGRNIATPLGRGAGLIMSLARADGIVRIPAMSEGIGAGEEVEIELLKDGRDIENTVVSIGSHDTAMDLMSSHLRRRHPKYSLSSAHVGSMGGLMALKRGEAHIAPTHLLDEDTGQYNIPFIKRLLPDMKITLINLAYRVQGLMVSRGNPKQIMGFEDLTRKDVTYINRQRGAGTRLLLDKHLKDAGISPDSINGYFKEEYTHTSVASAVLTGVADAGLGVLSAANALGLDFIPVSEERYDLAVPDDFLQTDMLMSLLDVINNDRDFSSSLLSMGGYSLRDMGKVLWRTRA